MQYRVFKNKIVARIDKGEEIVEAIGKIAEAENIKLATFSAIGAVNEVELGLFKTAEKEYVSNKYLGDFEIVSLQGNISLMQGKTYVHAHLSIADIDQKCFGGHCNMAVVSATCELVINGIEGEIDRKFSGDIGLNLVDFL